MIVMDVRVGVSEWKVFHSHDQMQTKPLLPFIIAGNQQKDSSDTFLVLAEHDNA